DAGAAGGAGLDGDQRALRVLLGPAQQGLRCPAGRRPLSPGAPEGRRAARRRGPQDLARDARGPGPGSGERAVTASNTRYAPLPPSEFGRELVLSGDLDPVYVLLSHLGWDLATRARFCVAYWMFYRVDIAAILAQYEGVSFWRKAKEGVFTFRRRGTERRHFRGLAANLAVEWIQMRHRGPEQWVEH